MTARFSSRGIPRISLFVFALAGVIALVGCTPVLAPTSPGAGTGDERTNGTVEEPVPAGLEDTDFGNLTWAFRPGGSVPETQRVELVDGVAADGTVRYELGEVLLAELSGDERIDAAVQLTMIDGNAIDEQWYLWIATDAGPVQSTLPIARMSRCGTVIHSVKAVAEGIEIHETRRTLGDDSIPCSDPGSDERTRTVRAVEARNAAEWWPVQLGPIGGFGGLCPSIAHPHPWENDGPLYSVPDTAAGEAIEPAAQIIELDGWPVYGEPFPGWVLVGVQRGDVQACAWAETA
jgi:hypothetical protein